MKQFSLNRRQFLQFGLGLGIAWSIGTKTLTHSAASPEQIQADLATLLQYQASAKIIGQRYLQHYPQEANIEQLLSLIAVDVVSGARGDPQELRGRLAQKIRQDFADERVVNLQGWLLARTEARLCALAVLV
jgi:hypothetical protein